MGSDHFPVHLKLHIGSGEGRKTTFKWNVSHLKGELMERLKERWNGIPEDANFFHKLRNIVRFFRQTCKQKAKNNRKVELDTKAKLEVAMTNIHEDIHSFEKQREVNQLKNTMNNIETRKAKGATIRSRVK